MRADFSDKRRGRAARIAKRALKLAVWLPALASLPASAQVYRYVDKTTGYTVFSTMPIKSGGAPQAPAHPAASEAKPAPAQVAAASVRPKPVVKEPSVAAVSQVAQPGKAIAAAPAALTAPAAPTLAAAAPASKPAVASSAQKLAAALPVPKPSAWLPSQKLIVPPPVPKFAVPPPAPKLAVALPKAEPAKQAPVKHEPIKQEPIKQEPAKQEPAKQEPAKPEPRKAEPSQPEAPKETRLAAASASETRPAAGDVAPARIPAQALAATEWKKTLAVDKRRVAMQKPIDPIAANFPRISKAQQSARDSERYIIIANELTEEEKLLADAMSRNDNRGVNIYTQNVAALKRELASIK
jgi:hypothetical protein